MEIIGENLIDVLVKNLIEVAEKMDIAGVFYDQTVKGACEELGRTFSFVANDSSRKEWMNAVGDYVQPNHSTWVWEMIRDIASMQDSASSRKGFRGWTPQSFSADCRKGAGELALVELRVYREAHRKYSEVLSVLTK